MYMYKVTLKITTVLTVLFALGTPLSGLAKDGKGNLIGGEKAGDQGAIHVAYEWCGIGGGANIIGPERIEIRSTMKQNLQW